MESAPLLRAGLIGCGYQGQWLARAATALDGYRLVACHDPDEKALEATAAIADVAIESSAAAVIQRKDVDVVFIATPHYLLQPYALQAIKAGKHVLAEKPIALNAAEAMELETALAANSVTYMAGYSFRYLPPVAEAKRLIAEGVIGEIQTISAGMSIWGVRPGWVADPAAGGGILGFYGCHLVDRVMWFLGDAPVEVSAHVTYHPDYGVDVTSLFQITFARGAVAQFNICGSATGMFDFAHFCGRDGHLYLAMAAVPNYSLTVASPGKEEYAVPKTTATALDRATAIQQKMEAELRDFAAAVWERRQPPITASDGREVLQVLDAVIASGLTGAPVRLGEAAANR